MLYACCGSHRSGKSSTAKQVAETLGIEFLDSSFNVARSFGYDPVAPMSIETRLEMQERVLGHHITQIAQSADPLITDRTPLDFLAYMTAEVGMMSHDAVPAEILDRVHAYIEACLEFTAQYYDMIFLLDPLPIYVVDDTKATPAPNPAFQAHIDLLIHGALSRLHTRINWATVPAMDLKDRTEFIIEQIVERMNEIDEMKKEAGMH